ncbi:hypothetical protein CERZMDRAFT_100056 [Cercospora zeae-maydis SCOH1-5]|uniref:Ketoreductase (KR) domain-containing protein n=1 Tax=Cercospora zeae-maydis SCOH1-5 TaxID=717836 RepID=A0A6A6F9H3_9PEZI|nr:hypothetical protein CERZMDRAFT_100056 [Cercospora zeae-maydis SCOH1-5]
MEQVLRPKVVGSINLDELVEDIALDFFVFFSSATAIIGSAGQCNYSAANLSMINLAHQRRQRGQAASVIHIGPILGGEYTFMSESDCHELFAEAVAARNLGSKLPFEISMGIPEVRKKPANAFLRRSSNGIRNPLSSHMTASPTTEIATKSSNTRGSVKSLLEKATTEAEVFEAL